MTKAYRISQVYDIATAFITDAGSFVEISHKENHIQYKFTQNLLNMGKYTLTITQPIGAAVKPSKYVHDWEVDYKQGFITLDGNGERLLLAQTRHGVGKEADKKSSDVEKWLARAKSRKFFKLINMVKQRTRSNLPLQHNSKEIFNIIYRLKELQK